MYTEEQLTQLEQEERTITDEAILAMLAILASLKSDLEVELRNFYSKYGKDGVVTYAEARKWASTADHRRRLTVLMLYVNENFNTLNAKLCPKFKSMLEDVIGKEIEFFNVEIPNVADKPLSERWGADEKTWLERLDDDIALWCVYILTDIKRNILKSGDINSLIGQLDKRFKSMSYVLETLGLSESTAVGSMARREIFKSRGITKYQFYTRPDERRCETCGAMHGLVFPISSYEVGVTASPIHPRCRCWEVPIVD